MTLMTPLSASGTPSAVPCVISVEEVFWDSAAGLGDAVPVAVAEYLLHRGRPHRLPQPRLTREGGGTQTDDAAVASKMQNHFYLAGGARVGIGVHMISGREQPHTFC